MFGPDENTLNLYLKEIAFAETAIVRTVNAAKSAFVFIRTPYCFLKRGFGVCVLLSTIELGFDFGKMG